VLGESIANALNKHVGDEIELQYQPYRIVGIAAFATVLNQNMALVPLAGLQQLLAREGTVTLYQVGLKRPFNAERMAAIREAISQAMPDFLVTTTEEFTHDIRLFRIIQAFAWTVSVVVLVMALLAVANTLLMAVNERTHEFGILAAIGWTPARTLGLILLEGLVISALGGVFGIGLGIVIMKLVSMTHIASGLLEPHLTSALAVQALVSVFAIGPLGALYPAWRAIRLTPAEALRRL
jgi:putative ABC transport system permease protein